VSVLNRFHGGYVHPRRVRVLADHLASLFSPGARVLDVGCGDGLIAAEVARRRPDLVVAGIDVLVRPGAHIPVAGFDGRTIPHADGAFHSVMLVDVLHHALDPGALLREATRVAASHVILKDHTRDSPLAGPILAFMDRVGNERHGVASVFNYWPTPRWQQAFRELDLEVAAWVGEPQLYPWPASLLFGRGLHFVAKLRRPGAND
jgi:SAM-dependent methyltransferase